VAGVLAVYVRDTVVDSDEFARRAAVGLADPVVGELIAKKIVDQIVAAVPNALALRPLLESAVSSAVGKPAFRLIFEAAIRDLHRTIFLGQTDTLAVKLTDMVLVVKTQAAVLAPELSDAIPDELTNVLIEVSAHPLAVKAVKFSEDVRFLAFVLPLAALIAFVAAVLLATNRRQALVWVGLSILSIGVIVLIVEVVLGSFVVRQFPEGASRDVARAFWDAFVSGLGVWGLVIAATGATLVAALWWVSEPIDVAARLGQLRRFIEPPVATWPRIGWVVCWSLIGVFLILSWQEAMRVVVTLVGVVFLVNALAELLRMIAPRQVGLARPQVARVGPLGPSEAVAGWWAVGGCHRGRILLGRPKQWGGGRRGPFRPGL